MVTLYPYQAAAVRELLFHRLRRFQRVVAVAPTGSGKTTISAALMKAWRGKRVLWVAHRIELLRQARRELIAAGVPAADVGILSGPEKVNQGARVLIASISMLSSPPSADVIVVDEAHRIAAKSYQTLLGALPDAKVLGLTATPERLDGTPLADTFQDMFVMAESVELIADGHIARPVCYGLSREKARELTKGLNSGKDYVRGKLAKAMSARTLVGDIVSECRRLAPGQATIVFAVNRSHGKTLLSRFVKDGRTAEYLDGETDSGKRAAILARLENGETEVVVNVDVLSEGFDCPRVKCVALARPTKSLTRFLQQVGRACRVYNGETPIMLDHAGNCWRFGLPEVPRDWSLDAGHCKGGHGAALKLCGTCSSYVSIGCTTCPECGASCVLERDAADLKEREVELQRLAARESDKAAAMKRIEAVALARNAPPGWAQQVLAEMYP